MFNFSAQTRFDQPLTCGTRLRTSWSYFAAPGTTTGLSDVDPSAAEITNVVIGNVGGTGKYKEVVSMAPGADMLCTDENAACVQTVGNPFDSTGLVSLLVCMRVLMAI